MKYKLIRIHNGKETVDSIDSLPIINRRLKTLRNSFRRKKMEFRIDKVDELCDSVHKYRITPHDGGYRAGGYSAKKGRNPKRK